MRVADTALLGNRQDSSARWHVRPPSVVLFARPAFRDNRLMGLRILGQNGRDNRRVD
jgi:hypothetical protein